MSRKNDLSQLLSAIDRRDLTYYNNLTSKKDFSDWVTMRWASSTQDMFHSLMYTNELVNVNFSSGIDHPEFQWMSIACTGKKNGQRHQWIAPPKKKRKASTDKYIDMISEVRPQWSDDEIALFIDMNGEEDITNWLKEYGFDV